MSFTAQLSNAVGNIEEIVDTTWRKSVSQAFNEVVQGTPVLTGAARASWLMGRTNNNSVGAKILNVTPLDVVPVGNSMLLFSNLPYIERLEDGYSLKAPAGMVKIVEARWANIVKFNYDNS